jgi:hypothetical protein
MELYTVPSEVILFIQQQFNRFGLPQPDWRVIEESAKSTIRYVAKHHFFPAQPAEAEYRYNNPGLTFPEKVQLIGPVEFITRGIYNVETLHIAVWSALIWCWSQEGIQYINWYSKIEDGVHAQREVPQYPVVQARIGFSPSS